MVTQVPLVAKIKILEVQVDLLAQQQSVCNPDTMKKELEGFRYQEEVFMAILDDYKKVLKETQRDPASKHI